MHHFRPRFAALALLFASPALAYLPPPEDGIAFEVSELAVEPQQQRVASLAEESARDARRALATLGANEEAGVLDERSGRWVSLWLQQPLLPGRGSGNTLTWEDVGRASAPSDHEQMAELVRQRILAFVAENRASLGVHSSELKLRVGVHSQGEVIQVHGQRHVQGLTVRGAVLTATLNHGNLVLLGTELWGDVEVSSTPALNAEQARGRLTVNLRGQSWAEDRREPYLEIWPTAASAPWAPGKGYGHRLVWVISPQLQGRVERYRAAVDAHSGEVLSIRDTNHYQTRNVQGGVYPISNDGMLPDGVEVEGYPMPFVNVNHDGGIATTDSGGNLFDIDGTISTSLDGRYVRIDETCGNVNESAATGDLDLGSSGGTNCTVPTGASAGNTHSARTVYYELNRIQETGRGQLPGNSWLQSQLTAQTNLATVCNAFWTGSVVQFFQEVPGCANLGELAGVIDHEWGHGMDDNGTANSVSSPGEGIADVFAALRINSSCPGRGALDNVCSGFGDPCTAAFGCTAARDIDWMRHDSQTPHDIDWAVGNAACGSSHCRGLLYAEAIWDLYKRDLPTLYGYDNNTALEVTTRLTYLGADNVTTWYTTSNGDQGGCAASSGYQQFLAADDDNGNLADGTPHMQAIFDAFDRHQVACNAPTVQDSGCSDRPQRAPTVQAVGTDTGAQLSWSTVPGSARYKVFRTDGVHGCDLGKAIVGQGSATELTDTGLQNGREYYYVVAGFGASDACMGPTSACATVVAGTGGSIFSDDFESGDVDAWASRVPE